MAQQKLYTVARKDISEIRKEITKGEDVEKKKFEKNYADVELNTDLSLEPTLEYMTKRKDEIDLLLKNLNVQIASGDAEKQEKLLQNLVKEKLAEMSDDLIGMQDGAKTLKNQLADMKTLVKTEQEKFTVGIS